VLIFEACRERGIDGVMTDIAYLTGNRQKVIAV
jgi:hypothetical protein